MSIAAIVEVWDMLKHEITDKADMADSLINILVSHDYSHQEIKEAFWQDDHVLDALSYHTEYDEEEDEEEEEYYEDDEEDDDWD